MGRHQLARRPNGSVKTPYFALKGGLNLVDAPLAIKEGMVLGAVNYELLTRDGYRRIDGFERYDGQLSPTSASYWILNFDNKSAGSLVEGAWVFGETSGAKGEALIDEVILGTTPNIYGYYVLTNVDGSFIDNENLLILGLNDGFDPGFSNGFG